MVSPRVVLSSSLVAVLLAASTSTVLGVNGGACQAPYSISIDPADFTNGQGQPNTIDNPYFPLVPGTTWVYDGEKEGAALHDVMTVTADPVQ